MKITIKDLAKHLGVSYSTVSKALNHNPLIKPETRDKVIQAAKELGYEPNYAAQRLVSKKSNVIGVIWPTLERVAPSALVTKINKEITNHHYSMLLSVDSIENSIDLFKRFQIDGAIVLNDRNVPLPESFSIPVVTYGIKKDKSIPVVDVGYRSAIEKAVHYLHALGHVNIALIGDFSPIDDRQIDKYYGFLEAMKKEGLHVSGQNLINTGGLDWYNGYAATIRLMQSSYKPTAIIGATYDISAGIVRALIQSNYIIPKDISVISYDNIPQMNDIEVPLTSVGVPVEMIAEETVKLIIKYLNNPTTIPDSVTLTPLINERQSCARADI